ncbi:MAG: HNH endonuclease [Polyangiaceae bacterium]
MSTRTLVLTPWLTPHRVISWQRAIVLFFLGKVEVPEEYDDEVVGPSLTLQTPAVVRLTKGTVSIRLRIRFSRINVFARDAFCCQYCGERKEMSALSFDHVIPRVRGGKTAWENIVAACYRCNIRKGSRTPEEAGMRLLRTPHKPSSLPRAPILRPGSELPPQWRGYCPFPEDSRSRVA